MNAMWSAEHIDAIRAIVERNAYGDCLTFDEVDLIYRCAWCGGHAPQSYGDAQEAAWDRNEDITEDDEDWYRLNIHHAPECPVVLARALVASATATPSAE